MKRITKKEQAKLDAIAEIRERLVDMAVGANGSTFDEDESFDLFMQLGAHGVERWLRAISSTFKFQKQGATDFSCALAHWNLGNFETFDSAAQWVYDQIEARKWYKAQEAAK